MSKLNDLITKLCPDGVPYKKLEKVAEIKRGRRVVKKELSQDNNSGYPVYQNSLKPLGYHTCSNEKAGTPFVIAAGSAGEIGYSDVDYWGADDCYSIECDDNAVNGRYIYHVLLLKQGRIKSQVRRASIPRLSNTAIRHLKIPVPPIEIQHEVVRILDNFMELEAELEAELAGRIEQYEYYRDRMLDKKNLERMDGKPVEMMKLSDVARIFDGTHRTPNYVSSGIKFVSVENIGNLAASNKFITEEAFNKEYKNPPERGDVLMTRIGSIGACAVVETDEPLAYYVSLSLIKPNRELIIPKFLRYAIEGKDGRKSLYRRTLHTAVPIKINLGDVGKVEIPVPSLATQERIVDILDRFDTLTTSLTDGISAEIAMRREQYEYWRSRILDFPRLPDDAVSDGK